MKLALIVVVLLGCTRSDQEFRKEKAMVDKANANLEAKREPTPFLVFEAKYKAAAKAALESIGSDSPAGPGIEKAKGRQIAPFLRSTTLPSGEKRSPSRSLWCVDECEGAPWIAQDPAKAGTIVVADVKYVPFGKYVDRQTNEERGDANDVIYTVRAVLMPEKLTVATWERHGSVLVGYDQYGREVPISSKEFEDDMVALFEGRVPDPESALPQSYSR